MGVLRLFFFAFPEEGKDLSKINSEFFSEILDQKFKKKSKIGHFPKMKQRC